MRSSPQHPLETAPSPYRPLTTPPRGRAAPMTAPMTSQPHTSFRRVSDVGVRVSDHSRADGATVAPIRTGIARPRASATMCSRSARVGLSLWREWALSQARAPICEQAHDRGAVCDVAIHRPLCVSYVVTQAHPKAITRRMATGGVATWSVPSRHPCSFPIANG